MEANSVHLRTILSRIKPATCDIAPSTVPGTGVNGPTVPMNVQAVCASGRTEFIKVLHTVADSVRTMRTAPIRKSATLSHVR